MVHAVMKVANFRGHCCDSEVKMFVKNLKKKSKLRFNDSKNELIINVRCIKCFINVPSNSKQTVNMENGL